ncbi:hypothetical protein [Pseudomonas sp. MWU13-2517]|uniref:hypothetical protein n=1 Tax=Pseudomonas sp. MWU13-2517 TaxID=2929055 RepID=UPI00200CC067|nr:hypothetical protein [Pseudomonas sp. MWU13-2517]
MTHASHIPHIEHALDGFHQSLAHYRRQMSAWYAQALDSLSHVADMPSLLGMDRVLRVGDSQRSVSLSDADFSTVARCPAGGVLQIESQFESVYDVPIGNIPVEVIGLDDGSSAVVVLDEYGKGSHVCAAGGRYEVRVQGGVSAEQVDALFASYTGLTADLEQWLRSQWKGFRPHWEVATASAVGSGVLAGSWAAIRDVWDSIKLVQAILEDPLKFAEQLGAEAA